MFFSINHLDGRALPAISAESVTVPAGCRLLTSHFGATIGAVVQTNKSNLLAITPDGVSEIGSVADTEPTIATTMGNLLIVGGKEGIHILRRDPDTGIYQSFGASLPLPSMRFRLVREPMPADSVTTVADLCDADTAAIVSDRLSQSGGTSLRISAQGPTAPAAMSLSNAVYSALYTAVRTHITAHNRFWQPFFVRYALRLCNGSVTAASPPVLLIPDLTVPLLSVSEVSVDSSDMTLNCTTGVSRLSRCRLEAAVSDNGSLASLRQLKGVVEGIEIAVTDSIDTFIADGTVGGFGPIRNMVSGGLSGQRPGVGHDTTDTEETLIFSGRYSADASAPVADHYIDASETSATSVWNIPARTASDITDDLSTRSVFYKVAFIPLDSLTGTQGYREVAIERNALLTLHSRPLLPDSFRPFARYASPKVLTVFNGRLNIVPERTIHSLPVEAASFTSGEASDSADVPDSYLTVRLRKDGRILTTGVPFPSRLLPPSDPVRWLAYPDTDAFEAVLNYPVQGKSLRLTLSAHPGLNCACFLSLSGSTAQSPADDDATDPAASESSQPSENVLLTSLPQCPFIFPPTLMTALPGRNTVDMTPARHSLSEGQFGSYPMYLFTADAGIFAMTCNDAGEWVALRPLSPHCAIAPVVSTPSGVVFLTSTAVMRLSGQQTMRLDTPAVADPPHILSALPFFNKITDSCGFYDFNPHALLPLRDSLSTLRGVYDAASDHLLLYRRGSSTYSYVCSLTTGHWALMHHPSPIADAIPAPAPSSRLLTTDVYGRLAPLTETDDPTALIVTTLDSADSRSGTPHRFEGMRVSGTGNAAKARCGSSITIYGSNTPDNWFPVQSVAGETAPAAQGTPWRHYIAAIVTKRVNQLEIRKHLPRTLEL